MKQCHLLSNSIGWKNQSNILQKTRINYQKAGSWSRYSEHHEKTPKKKYPIIAGEKRLKFIMVNFSQNMQNFIQKNKKRRVKGKV